MSGLSGVISPTSLSMFTSPVTTPRTTPRTTPIPRWSGQFVLDDNMDYNVIANLMHTSDSDPPHIIGKLIVIQIVGPVLIFAVCILFMNA